MPWPAIARSALPAGMDDYLPSRCGRKMLRRFVERWGTGSGDAPEPPAAVGFTDRHGHRSASEAAYSRQKKQRPWTWTACWISRTATRTILRELVTLLSEANQRADRTTRRRRPRQFRRGSAAAGPQLRRRQRHLRHDPYRPVAARTGTPGRRREAHQRHRPLPTTWRRNFIASANFSDAILGELILRSCGPKPDMKKVLIIEDDQVVANIYRNKLAVEGFQVEMARDGETGLDMVQSFRSRCRSSGSRCCRQCPGSS